MMLKRVRRAAPAHLKRKPYGVNEHFPPEVLKIRRDLLSIHKEARKRKLKQVFKRDKLYIEGELYDKKKHANLLKQTEASGGDTELQRNEVVIEQEELGVILPDNINIKLISMEHQWRTQK